MDLKIFQIFSDIISSSRPIIEIALLVFILTSLSKKGKWLLASSVILLAIVQIGYILGSALYTRLITNNPYAIIIYQFFFSTVPGFFHFASTVLFLVFVLVWRSQPETTVERENPQVSYLFTNFYVGSTVVGLAIAITSWILWAITVIGRRQYGGIFACPQDPASLSFSIAQIVIVCTNIVMIILIYKMWASIQDAYVRTSPGKAVGFLFIPIYNLYWLFQVFWGFAQDYNSHLDRYAISAPKLPPRLFLAYALTIFCLLITAPIQGILILRSHLGYNDVYFMIVILGLETLLLIVNMILAIIMVLKICNAVNALQIFTKQPLSAPDK